MEHVPIGSVDGATIVEGHDLTYAEAQLTGVRIANQSLRGEFSGTIGTYSRTIDVSGGSSMPGRITDATLVYKEMYESDDTYSMILDIGNGIVEVTIKKDISESTAEDLLEDHADGVWDVVHYP